MKIKCEAKHYISDYSEDKAKNDTDRFVKACSYLDRKNRDKYNKDLLKLPDKYKGKVPDKRLNSEIKKLTKQVELMTLEKRSKMADQEDGYRYELDKHAQRFLNLSTEKTDEFEWMIQQSLKNKWLYLVEKAEAFTQYVSLRSEKPSRFEESLDKAIKDYEPFKQLKRLNNFDVVESIKAAAIFLYPKYEPPPPSDPVALAGQINDLVAIYTCLIRNRKELLTNKAVLGVFLRIDFVMTELLWAASKALALGMQWGFQQDRVAERTTRGSAVTQCKNKDNMGDLIVAIFDAITKKGKKPTASSVRTKINSAFEALHEGRAPNKLLDLIGTEHNKDLLNRVYNDWPKQKGGEDEPKTVGISTVRWRLKDNNLI